MKKFLEMVMTLLQIIMSDGGDNSMAEVENCCNRCRECPACCLAIIKDNNLLRNAYPTLYVTDTFILRIFTVQVSSEHFFSCEIQ